MADIPSHDSQSGLGLSTPADSELPEELYQEFLVIKKMEELAGKPIPEMTEICRRMTPQQRLATGMRMTSEALREIRKAVLGEHPEWSQAQLSAEASRRLEALCA